MTPPPPGRVHPFILALWAYILGLSCHFGFVVRRFAVSSLLGLHFRAFWPRGPSFPCILALWAFISLHFGLAGFISLHFGLFGVSFWAPPTSCQKWPVCPTSLQWIYQRRDRLHFAVFSLLGFHFRAFWPCGPSFPCILALWAFISLHFGLVGLHFLAFWPSGPSLPFILAFSGSASGVPPTSCQKWPVCPTSLQWIYQRRDRLHFAVSSLLGLHFLAFWPCGPSFPCILALWAFISLHFGLVGLHFLAFWPCGPSFPCILALWAFISLHFGLVGLHFLAFWPCGLSFPFILAFSESASRVPPTSCQKWPVCPTSLQWIYQRRDRLHFAVFSLLGLHFLAFWPCGPSFPCILALWAFISLHFLALWAFISLHFGLVRLHFLSFWPFRGQLLGPPPQVARNGPFAQRPYNGFISVGPGSILQFLAFWAFISLHFGLVGLHFLAFWPCGPSFPCILAL